MKRASVILAAAMALALLAGGAVRAHCEIPCGIYGDAARIDLLYEHIATVEKSMRQIAELSRSPSSNANQLARWVHNKEEHCSEIQHVVTQYFMTQRIKPVAGPDEKALQRYRTRLRLLHEMLVHAMKAKQTTDLDHVRKLRALVKAFCQVYFPERELEQIGKRHWAGGGDS